MKKALSFAVALALLASMSTNIFAAESTIEEPKSSAVTNIEFVDKIEFKSLPEMNIDDLVEESSLPNAMAAKNPYSNINEGTSLDNNINSRSVTQSWSGTLANQGEFTYVIATLAPTQILNATLACPQNPNLNYDLFVYEVDAAGNLGNIVSASTTGTHFNTYTNGITKTVDEGVSYINSTSQTRDYAIIVSAVQGGSASHPFKLTLSLDVKGNYDTAEPNDSAYNAYGITEGNLSGASLHVINDQDWYIWRATSEFISAKISVSSGYKVEVYTANGNKMILTKQNTDGSFTIANGANYIRVFADETTFTPAIYSMSVTPWKLTPAKMLVLLNGDEGPTSYPSYPEGKNYLRFKDKFCPDVGISSASGYGVPNHPVTLYWESGSWNEHTGNRSRTVTQYTNAGGVTTLVLEKPNLPTSLGSISYYIPGPIQFTHYYDIDGIMISTPGLESYIDLVYHFSHSVYEGS